MSKHSLVFTILALFFITSGVFSASTSLFYKGGVLILDQPPIHINKIYGLNLSPENSTVTSGDRSIFFPHKVENLGNTSYVINIAISSFSKAKGWKAELIRDENANDIHEESEKTTLTSTQELGEGSTVHFFVKLTSPDDIKSGNSGFAVVQVSGRLKDGEGYIGYNGIKYGGPDEAESTDTVFVK